MSTPRTKRPFAGLAADPNQRQITSFFGNQPAVDAAAIEASRQPVIPSNIQANLLSVGMRVRKSVPEGYKTVGTSAFKLWTDNTKPSAMATPVTTRTASRELLPFCGINRVGGLDTQPDFEYDEVPGLHEVPELTMSQESVESNGPSRKRFFEENETEDSDIQTRTRANSRVLAVPRSRARKSTAFEGADQENMAVDNDFEDAEFLVYGDGEMDMAV